MSRKNLFKQINLHFFRTVAGFGIAIGLFLFFGAVGHCDQTGEMNFLILLTGLFMVIVGGVSLKIADRFKL